MELRRKVGNRSVNSKRMFLPWNREEKVVGFETVYMTELFVVQQTINIDKQTINKKKTPKEVITKKMKENLFFFSLFCYTSEWKEDTGKMR